MWPLQSTLSLISPYGNIVGFLGFLFQAEMNGLEGECIGVHDTEQRLLVKLTESGKTVKVKRKNIEWYPVATEEAPEAEASITHEFKFSAGGPSLSIREKAISHPDSPFQTGSVFGAEF